MLPGTLTVGPESRGSVVFAHGSGSSRLSPRNRLVSRRINEAGFGSLLFDLLTEDEATHRSLVFDVELLGDRLANAIRWLQSSLEDVPVGLFGASTGAAAALIAAAMCPEEVSAVVSRGGRPDLASSHLGGVKAPTLLIVGSLDRTVLVLNREALAAMTCTRRLELVDGASHLFEEPGTLERVASLAALWFEEYLVAGT